LYNIRFDPEERYELIDSPWYAGVVKQMQKELAKVMRETGLTAATDRMSLDTGIKTELPYGRVRQGVSDVRHSRSGRGCGSAVVVSHAGAEGTFSGG
jgi:hypothetical protein